MVSSDKQGETQSTPDDGSGNVEQQNATPTSQHVIARVHQLLEVGIAFRQ